MLRKVDTERVVHVRHRGLSVSSPNTPILLLCTPIYRYGLALSHDLFGAELIKPQKQDCQDAE
jgi:hypothetical protein